VISQNCDGLHRRSGLPAAAISELHGNGNVEICEECGASYFRDFKCERMAKGYDHFTGRFCACEGRLLNSTIDFGQNLPPKPLQLAEAHSFKADLHLALGSSLTVTPAANMPRNTKRQGGAMVTCNLQKTPLTNKADFQIFAKTDTVMNMLMERLKVPIPPFRLTRRILVNLSDDCKDVSLTAVDVHNPSQEVGVLRAVDWDGSGLSKRAAELPATVVACNYGGFHLPAKKLDLASVKPTLHFVGHYGEPCLTLSLDLQAKRCFDMLLSFDPSAGTWETRDPSQIFLDFLVGEPEIEPDDGEPLPDNWYGRDHRAYCIQSWIDRHGKSPKEAEAKVNNGFEQRREEAIAVTYALGGGSARERRSAYKARETDAAATGWMPCKCGFQGSTKENMEKHLERFLGNPKHGRASS